MSTSKLKIILDPTPGGGSRRLCEEMVAASLAHPSSSFIAIVPEQATLQMQRAVVTAHPAHAVRNIDIVSFERLAHKAFQELGYNEADILNDTGKVLILRRVLESCREDLILYRHKVHSPGFAAQMQSAVTELKQYTVDDNDLFLMQEAAQQKGNRVLFDKLQDIRLIYRKFNETIEEKYATQEEVLDIFARLVPRSELLRGAAFYLDGFTGFTPVQYRLIEALLSISREMTITVTLPGEERTKVPEELSMFRLSTRTLERLEEIARNCDAQVIYGEVHEPSFPPRGFYYQGRTQQEEVEFIARTILTGVREEGFRFRDYAVIVSDMESYHTLIRDTFREAGISCFLDYKTQLGDNALARFLIAAMQTVTERFSLASVFAWLKSSLTELSSDEVALLENYCLEYGIRGIRAWTTSFTRNRRLHPANDSEEPEYFWDLTEMNRLREEAIRYLAPFYRQVSADGRSAQEYSRALVTLMKQCRAEEHMQELAKAFQDAGDLSRGKEYEQIYELATDLLERIAQLMETETLSAREYAEILAGALDEIKVSIIPPSLDAVLVGDLTRSRPENCRVLFLAGANDGKLPSPPAHAGLFTQKEREFLKEERFELAPTALESLYTQYFYLYLMFTRPSTDLYLTCAEASADGEELLPSCILESTGDILQGLSLERAQEPKRSLWKEQAAKELSGFVRELCLTRPGEDESAEAAFAAAAASAEEEDLRLIRYFARKDPRILEQVLAGALFRNRALPLDRQTVLDLYGEVLRGSVSRYEKFYECPFRHFLQYGLKLEERPEYEIQATDIGTLYHDSLERYSKKLQELGLTFRDISEEDSHAIAREAAAESFACMESDVMTSTERSTYLLNRMAEVTEKTTDVLRMQVQQGLYEPEAYEFPFREDTQEGQSFRGKIDRVDIYDSGDLYVKIIDYKSGQKKFSIRDIYTGQQLQLVAYLSAAMKEMKKIHPDKQVKVGGVYYYLIQDRFVRTEKEAREKFRMSGLTSCEPEALRAIDLSAGPGQSSTIAEIGYTKSGLSSRSKVANEEEFGQLMAYVQGKIREVGTRVRAGEVSISPSYESTTSHACRYCEFRDVCKFEPGKWGSDFQKLPADLKTEDMEREIYGRG